MRAAIMTRPDDLLTSVAHNLAMFCDDLGLGHWKSALNALPYFWPTKDLGITYGGVTSGRVTMSAYVDSDHATCPASRHSISAGAVMLGGGAINWFSRAQMVTASIGRRVHHVYFEVQLRRRTITLRCSRRRTCHIDVNHHIIRDAVAEGLVRIVILEVKINMLTYSRRL